MEYLSCQVDLAGGDLSCTADGPALEGGALGAIIGGQGVYVELSSSSVGYDSGSETFSANVRVKNLSDQTLGSADGATSDAAGVRIFFVDPPNATGGSGAVTVANADGKGDFSGTDQDYFQYSQPLAPGQTSLARNWEWDVPSTVTSFNFKVGVSAEVRDESTLEPGLNFQVTTLAADSAHTCFLDLEGQAYCWGRQNYGKLGNGVASSDVAAPGRVLQGDLRFVSISTGYHHACALDIDGAAWCWGNAEAGRLGHGVTDGWAGQPVAVLGGHTFLQIVTGRRYTCGLTVDNDAYCWGASSSSYSELGGGTFESQAEPSPVAGNHKFASIDAGRYHACGITTGGETYCWGNGSNGRLGNGTTTHTNAPVLVSGGHEFVRVRAGNGHTCALTAEGEAWCWGSAANVKLGVLSEDGAALTGNHPEPLRVTTGLRFLDIQPTQLHTCALAIDGKTYCWGANNRGRLGNGTTDAVGFPAPTAVVGEPTFTEITVGVEHTCGKSIHGQVFCWGRGDDGQIGNGMVYPAATGVGTPSPVEISAFAH